MSTMAPTDPEDRAWWHLAIDPALLYADQREALANLGRKNPHTRPRRQG